MFAQLKMSALALMVTASSTLVAPHFAKAQDVIIDLDRKGGPRLRVDDDDDDVRSRGSRYREERRRPGDDCSPERALDKAERLGVRRARVDRVGRRTIEVRGRLRGERVVVTVGRSRGCPILDY